MNFLKTDIAGVYISEPKRLEDNRGFFFRGFCRQETESAGIVLGDIVQINHSFSRKRGTFRGLHYQRPPDAEEKIVSCIQGEVLDIVVDLRKGSESFLSHVMVNLSEENSRSIIIPKGCAHGFITLKDDCRLLYLHTAYYSQSSEGGCSIHDPMLGITLPIEISEISERDKTHAFITKEFTGIQI